MAVPPQLLIMLAQEAKKKRKEVWQKTDSILRNTVAPAVSTTAGMINMYNDQSEDPNVGTGMWSGALQQGALGYQSGGLRGLVGGGVLGGITSGLTTLNRAEQKSISDENADLNKMYGSMVGDDLDLQMLLHGKTGGEVTSSNPENQTEFVPIQAEARMVKTKGRNGKIINKLVKEKLAFADGKISDVNAKKSHSEMPKDFVTDVVKAGTYVFPVFTKLNKKDLNSLVSYGQGNYEENGDNFEISEIRLKDILGEDFQGSFAEAADIVDKKYPLSDVTDRSDRISVATNNDNARNRMLYINHLIRLNEAKMSGEPVEDMTISPEKKVIDGGYIRNMKTGGVVGEPPRKKKSSWRDYSVKVSSASTQDSMNLYSNARAVDKYYGNKKYELIEEEINSATDPRHTMNALDFDNRGYYKKKDYSPETAPGGKSFYGIGFRTGENFLRNSTSRTPEGMMFVEDYRIPIDENKFKQRESSYNILDTRSPHQLFDRRVNPTRLRQYVNRDERDSLGGDVVEVYMYDPAIVAPESMIHKLSPVELKRRQEYQKSNGMKVSILKPKDRGKLSVNPLPTEIEEIPINAPDVNMKLTGRIKPGGLAEGEFKREWKGVPNLDIIYTKKDGQSIPTYIQNKAGERIPYSEKPTKEFQYPEHFKVGGFVVDPPKKKPYSVSWNNSSSGAAEVNPVAKSEYATRESRETYKDNNKKQADIDERANAILKTKKPGEYSGEDIQLINSSTLKNKDIVVGDDNIAKSNAAQEKGDSWTAEGFKNSTQAVGDKLSLRRLPGVGEYIPGFFDVTKGIGDMASGLGEIPYDVQQGDYGAAAGKVALPLAVGAIGGIGAQNTGQFVNNIVNPVAGLFEGGIGTKKELKDLYDVVTNKKKPISGLNPNEKEILDSSRYVGGLVADGSTERSLTALENIKKRADRLSEDEFQKLTGFPKSQIDDRIEEMKNGLSKKNNEAEEFDYAAPLTQRQRAQYRDQGIFLGDEFDLTPDLNYLPPPPEELIIPGLSTNEAQRVNQIRTNLRGYTDNLTSIDPQLAGRIYRNDGTDFSFINNNSDFRLARRGLKWQEQRVGRIIRDEPSFISKIKDRVQNFEKPVPIDPATQTLVSSSFRGKGANPVQQVVKAYNEVKNAPKGSSFLSSGSLSADSYNRLTLPLIEKSLKEGLVDVNFHGYKMLNKMSFPEKAGISNEIILKEMNDKILSINKLTGKNYPLGEMAGDFIKYPEFTVKKLKKGGFVN